MKGFNDSYEGAPISATNENARNRAIRRGTPIAGPGLLSRVTSQGTVLTPAPSRPVRSVPQSYPFRVVQVDGLKVRIIPGRINDLMPVIGATALNASTPPELTVVTTSPFVAAAVVTDLTTGTISVPEVVNIDDMTPTVSGTTRTAFLLLAELTYSSGAISGISQNRFWNIRYSTWANEDFSDLA